MCKQGRRLFRGITFEIFFGCLWLLCVFPYLKIQVESKISERVRTEWEKENSVSFVLR